MKIRYWGVRGSVPVPGKSTLIYGGNTSCLSVEAEGRIFIFDAGTGIRACGNYLLSLGVPLKGSVFITHTHWDHIQGFPFFIPSYIPGNTFTLYGPPSDIEDLSLKRIMEMQTRYEYFPVRINQLGADMVYVDCKEGKVIVDGGFEIHTCRINHPVACLAYKLIHNGKKIVYGGDHEPYRNLYRDSPEGEDMDEDLMLELDQNAEEQNKKIAEFCLDADVVSWDSQYTEDEYKSKIGWGHSWHEANILLAETASIKHMIFTHHDPLNADDKLESFEKKFKTIASQKGFKLDFAKEGMEIDL